MFSIFFGRWKNRENVAVLHFLAVDNFDLTRKISRNFFEKFEKWKDNLRFWTWGGWRTRTWGWSRPCSTVCLRRSYETLLMLDPIQSRGSAIRDNFIFFLAKQIRAKFSATSSHLFSFFPLEIEVRNRHRAPKQQHNHSSQQAQAHHHAVTTQTLSRLTHTHSGKIGRGTFSAQATSQH